MPHEINKREMKTVPLSNCRQYYFFRNTNEYYTRFFLTPLPLKTSLNLLSTVIKQLAVFHTHKRTVCLLE